MDMRCTSWTTSSINHCPYGDQTCDSFQAIGLASHITYSQFQKSVRLQIMTTLHQGDIMSTHYFVKCGTNLGRQR